MTNREIFLLLGMAMVTFGIRFVLFAVADRMTLPNFVERSLKFIPPAVLTAITVPAVLMPEGKLDISMGNSYLIAGLLATIAGILSKNLLITILVGLIGFFIYRLLLA